MPSVHHMPSKHRHMVTINHTDVTTMPIETELSPLFTREQLRLRLNELGFPLTASYFNKICLPSRNAGPPIAKWWGKRPLYQISDALAWAEARCTAADNRRAA